jgi:hypothetical protein
MHQQTQQMVAKEEEEDEEEEEEEDNPRIERGAMRGYGLTSLMVFINGNKNM